MKGLSSSAARHMLICEEDWFNREEYNSSQLEGTYNDHLFQLPDHFRAELKLNHVVKGFFKCLLCTYRLGASATTRKLVPVFDHPLSKKMHPSVQSKPPLVQL